jgi:hypothetical protein
VRSATSLYQRAREIDQGNAEALLGLERSLAEVEKKNQIAVPTPQTQGEIDAVSREMFRRTLTDKLSAVRGLHVIETEHVAEVDAELDRPCRRRATSCSSPPAWWTSATRSSSPEPSRMDRWHSGSSCRRISPVRSCRSCAASPRTRSESRSRRR